MSILTNKRTYFVYKFQSHASTLYPPRTNSNELMMIIIPIVIIGIATGMLINISISLRTISTNFMKIKSALGTPYHLAHAKLRDKNTYIIINWGEKEAGEIGDYKVV